MSTIILMSIFSILNPFNYFNGNDLSQKSEMAYRVNYQSGFAIAKKYDMKICGVGLQGDEYLEDFDVLFVCTRPVTSIDEARLFLYQVCKDHYDNIKGASRIQPYLISPFTLKNISVGISFEKVDGGNVYKPNIDEARYFLGDARFTIISKDEKIEKEFVVREEGQYFFDIAEGRVPPPVYKELQE